MPTSSVRPPAAAGSFYPADESELRHSITACLGDTPAGTAKIAPPKALIAPHAGYVYSGAIAGTAYARLLSSDCRPIRRVVLMGPAHRVAVEGIALSEATEFATPLGRVAVAVEARSTLLGLPGVEITDVPHELDHALEVQLPFLQHVLPHPFEIVPLLVGNASAAAVDGVLEALWGGRETLIVVSSDLSHFLPYDEGRRTDTATSRAIEKLAPDEIAPTQACGRIPIQALLAQARRRGLASTTLDLRSSGDTSGNRDQVVGYGAYIFTEESPTGALSGRQRDQLLTICHQSLSHAVTHGTPLPLSVADFEPPLTAHRATFVTLRIEGELRGCMGSSEAVRPLVEDVAHNAYAAGFLDPRFPALAATEIDSLDFHISVLSELQEMSFSSEEDLLRQVRPGIDGLLIQGEHRRGTLLPSVWDMLGEPRRFLRELKAKAGLAPDYWSDSLRVFRYTTESF